MSYLNPSWKDPAIRGSIFATFDGHLLALSIGLQEIGLYHPTEGVWPYVDFVIAATIHHNRHRQKNDDIWSWYWIEQFATNHMHVARGTPEEFDSRNDGIMHIKLEKLRRAYMRDNTPVPITQFDFMFYSSLRVAIQKRFYDAGAEDAAVIPDSGSFDPNNNTQDQHDALVAWNNELIERFGYDDDPALTLAAKLWGHDTANLMAVMTVLRHDTERAGLDTLAKAAEAGGPGPSKRSRK